MDCVVSKMARLNLMENTGLTKLVGSKNDCGLTNDFTLQTILLSTFRSVRMPIHYFG
jgi:hypothetical protein